MCAVEDFVFVGVYSEDRMLDYARPGYEHYARSLAEEIVPEAATRLSVLETIVAIARCARAPRLAESSRFTAYGNTLEVFGSGVCMSSTFSHKDNLIERVLTRAHARRWVLS